MAVLAGLRVQGVGRTYARRTDTAHVDRERSRLGQAPIGDKQPCFAGLVVIRGARVHQRYVGVAGRVVTIAVSDHLEDLATGQAAHLFERVGDRLLPCVAAWLGAQQSDDVDQLSLAGDGDPVGVPKQ